MLVDLDTVWNKDPFKQIEEAGHHDLYATKDGSGGKICGCFLFFNPTPKATEAAALWVDRVEHDTFGNQKTLNEVLNKPSIHKELDLKVLPWAEFPPGNVAENHKHATIYHANYMKGIK